MGINFIDRKMALWIEATTNLWCLVSTGLSALRILLCIFGQFLQFTIMADFLPRCTPTSLSADDLITYRTLKIEALESQYSPNICLIPRTTWKT